MIKQISEKISENITHKPKDVNPDNSELLDFIKKNNKATRIAFNILTLWVNDETTKIYTQKKIKIKERFNENAIKDKKIIIKIKFVYMDQVTLYDPNKINIIKSIKSIGFDTCLGVVIIKDKSKYIITHVSYIIIIAFI